MLLFFRLPFVLLEMVLRQGVRGLASFVQLLRGGEAPEHAGPPPSWTSAPPAPPEPTITLVEEEPAASAPPTAEEAIRRREAREAEAQVAGPVTPPEPAAPLRGVDEDAHVDRESSLVESFGPVDEPHGAITVDEPWDGYDGMPANAVVSRLRGSDQATKAVVRLYEETHKGRQTILRATG